MQPVQTRVESVTLYHRGATVRRVATVDLAKGPSAEVLIAPLPLSLVDHTVRVRVEAAAGPVVVTNVRVGLFAPPRGLPELSPDEKELRALRHAIEAKRDKHPLAAIAGRRPRAQPLTHVRPCLARARRRRGQPEAPRGAARVA
jgi:hypothetical protein